MPVPVLDPPLRARLAAAYDQYAQESLGQLRFTARDQFRTALDDEVAKSLGVGIGDVAIARHELGREPSVNT